MVEKHMRSRVVPCILGIVMAIGLFACNTSGQLAATAPPDYPAALTGSPAAGGTSSNSTAAALPDASALCDQGGYVQFTPDGTQPFGDAAACIDYAAQHGGTQGLIRRVSVFLMDYGTGAATFARFRVTGLVPDGQYRATLRIQGRESDATPVLFTADERGSYLGEVASGTAACTGGIKLFVDITTLTGYFLGTNGTFLPC
jgi:hypothetical protein